MNPVIKRIIEEVSGTIETNGIQELSKAERGGVSQFGYVRSCLIATAYNSARSLPDFNLSYSEFANAVLAKDARRPVYDAWGKAGRLA